MEFKTATATTTATPTRRGVCLGSWVKGSFGKHVQRQSFIADVAEPCIDVPGRPHGLWFGSSLLGSLGFECLSFCFKGFGFEGFGAWASGFRV